MEQSQNFHLAFELHSQKKFEQAKDLYMQILKDEPHNHEVWDLLGVLNFQSNDYLEAELCIKKAISLEPQLYYVENLAKLYNKMGNFEVSIPLFEDLLQVSKTYDKYFNLAIAYKSIHNFEKAKENYLKAVEINPNGYEAHFNLAYLALNKNEPLMAVESYKKALELNPEDYEIKYFLGLAYMQAKDYKNGFENYEARLCRKSAIVSQQKVYPELMKKPIWRGEDLKNKTIYTYYEAGFGDVLMFCRYIPILTKMAKKVIVKPQMELADLFKQNSYGAQILNSLEQESELDFDYHIPILSIPYVLGLVGEEVFVNHDKKYLKATKESISYYREKYCQNNKFKIGIKWQGNAHYDKERILNVEDFFKLFDIENTQFYSFQTLDGSEEFEKFKGKYNIIDLGSTFNSFADTAGAIENMDLIIANDTSLIHLAGAMQKKTWVLLPHVYNWRWHTDLTKCDWYDSVKIFRQPDFGDWKSVFDEVEQELKLLVLSK